MATRTAAVTKPETAQPDPGEGLRYVARQPILDLRGKVFAYELLFRSGRESAFRGDGDLATRTMLDNSVIFGFDKLTGGLPAFINCTRESLTEQLVDVLPTDMTVLEILENIEPTPSIIEACCKLKADGFRLALDDFVWHEKFEPLIDLADFIKVDFTLSDHFARVDLFRRVGNRQIIMLAEKVETQEEYELACQEGFSLFQGYYFCRPTLIENRKVPANRMFHLQIMQLLHENPINLHKLGPMVKRDVSITYRLLRLVNSPVCAMRQEVRSIDAAILAVGDDTFRRIATLAIASEMNTGQTTEVLRLAFVRGRFCELAAELCNLDSTEQYLLGMLSLLPAMLRVSMRDLAPSLPLRDEIREALLGMTNREGCLLHWLESSEQGDWSACDLIALQQNLKPKDLARCYSEAVIWTETALQTEE